MKTGSAVLAPAERDQSGDRRSGLPSSGPVAAFSTVVAGSSGHSESQPGSRQAPTASVTEGKRRGKLDAGSKVTGEKGEPPSASKALVACATGGASGTSSRDINSTLLELSSVLAKTSVVLESALLSYSGTAPRTRVARLKARQLEKIAEPIMQKVEEAREYAAGICAQQVVGGKAAGIGESKQPPALEAPPLDGEFGGPTHLGPGPKAACFLIWAWSLGPHRIRVMEAGAPLRCALQCHAAFLFVLFPLIARCWVGWSPR